MWKPLRNDIVDANKIFVDMNLSYNPEDEFVPVEKLVSAVEGLIKYHETEIENLIMIIKDINDSETKECYLFDIKREYKDIMLIEHWLEDAIDV